MGWRQTIRGEVGRVAATVERTIADAGLKAADITAVFLTGGSTAIPLARRSILSLVPQASVVEGDVFGSVGLGLALDAQEVRLSEPNCSAIGAARRRARVRSPRSSPS